MPILISIQPELTSCTLAVWNATLFPICHTEKRRLLSCTILHTHRAPTLMPTHTDNEDHVFTATRGHIHSFQSQRAPSMAVTTVCLQRKATATPVLESTGHRYGNTTHPPLPCSQSHTLSQRHIPTTYWCLPKMAHTNYPMPMLKIGNY